MRRAEGAGRGGGRGGQGMQRREEEPQALMWATNNVLLFGCPPKLPTKTKVVLAQYCQ